MRVLRNERKVEAIAVVCDEESVESGLRTNECMRVLKPSDRAAEAPL